MATDITWAWRRVRLGAMPSRCRRATLIMLVAVLWVSVGCITPPVIFPAGSRQQPSADHFPEHAELIEIEVEDGIFLRGIFMPSDERAPVVLHLLEAGGSVGPYGVSWSTGSGSAGMISVVRPVFAELAQLGFASLAVDYEGVGASDGERSARNLNRDARAAWMEAVRRAGGVPDRVLVRGTSIGTLATACLLDSGAQPAGLVLAAPVFSDSVSRNYGRAVYGAFLTALVVPLFDDVTEVDLDTALTAHPTPHLIWVLAGDELLSDDDLARLQSVADRSGGRLHRVSTFQEHRDVPEVVRLPRHVRGALAARSILPSEAEFLKALFPELPPKRRRITAGRDALPVDLLARFPAGSPETLVLDRRLASRLGDDPELVAWTALCGMDDEDADWLLRFMGDIVRGWRAGSVPAVLSRRLDMDDPAGVMPLLPMLRFARSMQHYNRYAECLSVDEVLSVVAGCGAPGVEKMVWKPELMSAQGTPFLLRLDLHEKLWKPVFRDGALSPSDAARQVLRLVLKATNRAERVVTDLHGNLQLEVRDGEQWRVVDPGLVIEAPTDDA